MNTNEIVEALREATGGTFEMPGTRTLMGWVKEYDEKGREVIGNPNYVDYTINIGGTEYAVTKVRWKVYIWKPEYAKTANRTWRYHPKETEDRCLTVLDIKPEYVKEYEAKKEKEFEEKKIEFLNNGLYVMTLWNFDDTQIQLIGYKGELAIVELSIERVKHLGNGLEKTTTIAERLPENLKSLRLIQGINLQYVKQQLKKIFETKAESEILFE